MILKISRHSSFLDNHVDKTNNFVKQTNQRSKMFSGIQSISLSNQVRRLAKTENRFQRSYYSVLKNLSLDSQVQHSENHSSRLIAGEAQSMIASAYSNEDSEDLTEQKPETVGLAGEGGMNMTTDVIAAEAENYSVNRRIGSLSGEKTLILPNVPEHVKRALQRENESALILFSHGYDVEQNPVTPGAKNPDYKINGEVFDNIAPTTQSFRNLFTRIRRKVNSGQANNLVINLVDSNIEISLLQRRIKNSQFLRLGKVIIIDKSGNPAQIR